MCRLAWKLRLLSLLARLLLRVESVEDVSVLVLLYRVALATSPIQLCRRARRHDLRHVGQPSLIDDERCVEALVASGVLRTREDAEVVEVGL